MPSIRNTRQCKTVCGCGRIVRVSKKVYEQGPTLCDLCHEPFAMAAADVKAIRKVRGRWG